MTLVPSEQKRIDPGFWKGKKVFVTGHTGFKGTWLCLWLHSLGAHVTGYSLRPPTEPNLFQLCGMKELVTSYIADIRNQEMLSAALQLTAPDVVFHLAAQPLVRESFANPVETYEINMMGTVYLLEAVRQAAQNGIPIQAVVNVTSDKCYDNQEWTRGYREDDRLGGSDPYSNSKAGAEMVTAGYRKAFFSSEASSVPYVPIASARAGNVIGGGDWAKDRLIPGCIKALLDGEPIKLRYPHAIRPWQHVLEPLYGYLLLAQRLAEEGSPFAKEWNFGPDAAEAMSVERVVGMLCELWGAPASFEADQGEHPFEVHRLQLDCSRAHQHLGWYPRWDLRTALLKTLEWVKGYAADWDLRELCLSQIREYEGSDGSP